MPIKTSSAKQKGRKLQQYVSNRLRDIFGIRDGDIASRPMGSPGVDIMMAAGVRDIIPFSIECKSTKSPPASSEMKQADANRYPLTIAGVCWKPHGADYKDSVITFRFNDFMNLWKQRTLMAREEVIPLLIEDLRALGSNKLRPARINPKYIEEQIKLLQEELEKLKGETNAKV